MVQKDNHYEYLADFFAKTALVVETTLIFGQFIPGFEINWYVMATGMMVTIGLIIAGYFVKKKSQRVTT